MKVTANKQGTMCYIVLKLILHLCYQNGENQKTQQNEH